MAIVINCWEKANGSNTEVNQITLTKPTALSPYHTGNAKNPAVGDYLLIVVTNDSGSGTAEYDGTTYMPFKTDGTTSAGFTFLKQVSTASGTTRIHAAAYLKKVDGTEESSFIVKSLSTKYTSGMCFLISGMDTTTGYEGTITDTNAASGTLTISGVTASADNALAIGVCALDGGDAAPWTVSGTNWTEVANHYDNAGVGNEDIGSAIVVAKCPVSTATTDDVDIHGTNDDGIVGFAFVLRADNTSTSYEINADSGVTFDWVAGTGTTTDYDVYLINKTTGVETQLDAGEVDSTTTQYTLSTAQVRSMTPGPWAFTVIAQNEYGDSARMTEVEFTFVGPSLAASSAPTDNITSTDSTHVDVTWDAGTLCAGYEPYVLGPNTIADKDFSVGDPTTNTDYLTSWIESSGLSGWSFSSNVATHTPITDPGQPDRLFTLCMEPNEGYQIVLPVFTCTAGSLEVCTGQLDNRISLGIFDSNYSGQEIIVYNADVGAGQKLVLEASYDFAGTIDCSAANISCRKLNVQSTVSSPGFIYTTTPGTGVDVTYRGYDNAGNYTDYATVGTITSDNSTPPALYPNAIYKITDYQTDIVIDPITNNYSSDGSINTPILVNSVEDTAAAAHGTVTITDSNTTITYSPDASWTGLDYFGYKLKDSTGTPIVSSEIFIIVYTQPSPGGQIVITQPTSPIVVTAGVETSISMSCTQSNDEDVTWTAQTSLETYDISYTAGDPNDKSATLTFTPVKGEYGTHTIRVLVSDGTVEEYVDIIVTVVRVAYYLNAPHVILLL